MAATIMMPSGFDDAIRSMCLDAVGQAVAVLAAKYGFDAEEAQRDVSELKLMRKRGPSPKKEKKEKKEKKASDDSKTKRPKTGYLLFQAKTRAEVVAALTEELEDGAKLQGKDVIRGIAAKWKALSVEEQKDWKQRAKDAATPEVSEEEEVQSVDDEEEDLLDGLPSADEE